MKRIILDTDTDTLYCYECRHAIEPDEEKVVIGYGNRGGAWGVWHPGCLPEEVEPALQQVLDEYQGKKDKPFTTITDD